MRITSGLPITALVWAMLTIETSAQVPVAIVEDVQDGPTGVEFMEYVETGKVISLGTRGRLVLGYLKSCQRETIIGGTVTVGVDQSEVNGGRFERGKIACEVGKMQLTAELASKSGAMVFRDVPRNAQPSTQQLRPQFMLYGLSPIVEIRKGSTLVIERVDKPGERYEIGGLGQPLIRGAFYDFAAENKALVASGIYKASTGTLQVLFQIDAAAKPGATPIAGRLLRLQPAP